MKTVRALAIRTARPPALRSSTCVPFRHAGSRTAIQTDTGSVAAVFALDDYDKRLNAAAYSLRIMNNTDTTLVCRVWAITRNGEALFAYPPPFEIAPYSAESKEISVLLDQFDAFERALAEITGNGVRLIVEAAAPAVKRKPRLASLALAVGFLIAFAAFAAAALGMSLPRVLALAAPPTASTGTTVEAEYATSGLGQLKYVVEGPDGRHIQEGTLVERSGAISIAIPPSQRPGAYTLQLTKKGLLGTDKEVRVLNAEPPQIIYRKGAQAPGIPVAPLVARIVEAMRDAKLVVALPHKTLQGIAAADGQDPAPAEAAANGVFQVERSSVKSGGTIGVRILSPRNGMLLSLTDMRSRQISSRAVGIDQDLVQLRAPLVGVATRYVLVMTFDDGFGQESIVQPVTVAP